MTTLESRTGSLTHIRIPVEPRDFISEQRYFSDGSGSYPHSPICGKFQDAMRDRELVEESRVQVVFHAGPVAWHSEPWVRSGQHMRSGVLPRAASLAARDHLISITDDYVRPTLLEVREAVHSITHVEVYFKEIPATPLGPYPSFTLWEHLGL